MHPKRRPPPGNIRIVQSISNNTRSLIVNKQGNLAQAESFAERILFLLLERDRRVRDYCSQPAIAVVTWTDSDGVTHRYVPDAIVWYWDGQIVVYEVTRSERRDLEKAIAGRTLTADQIAALRKTVRHSREREKEAGREYGEHGWGYVVLTQDSLPQATEVANLLALYRYRATCHADEGVASVVMDRLAIDSPCTLDALVTLAAYEVGLPTPQSCAAVCHYLWRGAIAVDLCATLLFRDGDLVPNVGVWLPREQS